MATIFYHERTLRTSAGFHAEAVDKRQRTECHGRDQPVRRVHPGKLDKVAREGDRYSRHASSLDDEQQHPSIQKCNRWMIGLAQVSVLAADFGQRGRQFSPYKGAAHSNHAADNPGSQDQRWGMHLLRYYVRIYEYAGTDDAAHDQHGGVEQP